MPSKRKLTPVVGRAGVGGGFSREQEISTVELDSAFGRLLGLTEGQKVSLSLSYIIRPDRVMTPYRSDYLYTLTRPLRIQLTSSH